MSNKEIVQEAFSDLMLEYQQDKVSYAKINRLETTILKALTHLTDTPELVEKLEARKQTHYCGDAACSAETKGLNRGIDAAIAIIKELKE